MALSPQQVHRRLRDSARRLRLARAVRFGMFGGGVSLFFLAACLFLDAELHLSTTGRWIGFVLIILPVALAAARALLAWRIRISEASIARRIETACENSRNALINAVQFDRELAADSPLREALFEEMPDLFPRVQWSRVFDWQQLRRLVVALAFAALIIGAWATISPARFTNSAARIFLPAGNIAPLTLTQILSLQPSGAQLVRGEPLAVTAKLGGDIPDNAWLWFRESGSTWQKTVMNRITGQPVFNFHWNEVRQPLEFYIVAGDARSDIHNVAVRSRTAISTRSAALTPPAYTKLPAQTIRDFNSLQNIVPGTRVTVTLDFNYPLAELRVMDERGQPLVVEPAGAPTRWSITDQPTGNRNWKLTFRDANDFSDADTISISTKPDTPPKIQITNPADGKEIIAARNAALDVEFVATDNFGLGSVALYRSIAETPDAKLVQEWPDAAGKTSVAGATRIPLAQFTQPDEERAAFVIVARDQNNVTGPGVTFSRPLVVTLRSPEQVKQQLADAKSSVQQGLDDLIRLQQVNLDDTRGTARANPVATESVTPLLTRQSQVTDLARSLVASATLVSPKVRDDLRALIENEMKETVLVLRNAVSSAGDVRVKFLERSIELELQILIKLQGAPESARQDEVLTQIQDVLAGLEDLLRQQVALHKETGKDDAVKHAPALAVAQDALADQSQKVRRDLATNAQNAPLGDRDFADRLKKVAGLFGEFKIYEDMLAAAEKLEAKQISPAGTIQQQVIGNLRKLVELLNAWRLAQGERNLANLKATLDKLQDKLDKLIAIQHEVVEKSKELARKDQFNPDDQAVAKEIKETKDLMKDVVEQMLTDAHAFPELKPGNELRSELVNIFEDVIQTDKAEAAEGNLKPQEIAVQKEEGILQALEEAKKISEDMEMWLPNKLETQKWLMENFDVSEMPDIPMLPLPDAFEDLVGKLMDEQQGLDQQVQDAASNQAFAQNPGNGWEVRDGPMPGFGAQGRSGNERPNKNEQTGRSSGGREGMSDGEMAGDTASHLEGTKPDARRTREPFQQGQVKDDTGPSPAVATGGGKVSGFSDRQGMDGNAPLRPVNAPRVETKDALAAAQGQLAEKTAKTYAQANLLYLRADELPAAIRLMHESEQALKEGRLRDYASLRAQIVQHLTIAKGQLTGNTVLTIPQAGSRVTDKQILGGSEGDVPAQYKEQVADYYRSLAGEK
jgi:hypothetical protein